MHTRKLRTYGFDVRRSCRTQRCSKTGTVHAATGTKGCTGVTISREQLAFGRQRLVDEGIEHLVDLRLQDYRDIDEQYDRIVSIGMFEHVGQKYYDVFMKTMARSLKDDGLMLLHTIGFNDSTYFNPWLDKYIFPGCCVPSLAQLTEPMENVFTVEHLQNIGVNYDRTLVAWQENFARSWPEIAHEYDERFYRMWNYYLLSCAAGFRGRFIQVWQLVLSKDGIAGGYYFDE